MRRYDWKKNYLHDLLLPGVRAVHAEATHDSAAGEVIVSRAGQSVTFTRSEVDIYKPGDIMRKLERAFPKDIAP